MPFPATTAGPLSPPLRIASGVSSDSSASWSVALWQAVQLARKIGRISRAKSTGSERFSSAI